MNLTFVRYAISLVGLTVLSAAQAETLQQTVQRAVQTNPEIRQKWHALKAAGYEHEITLGRFLPTVDLVMGVADSKRESPTYIPPGERDYTYRSNKLTLRQNVFEGFATTLDAARLRHAAVVRYFELRDLSEQMAYEAAKAHIDVWRHRELRAYAEESYATHRLIYEKINERVGKGVSRRVDLETAAGRLALAESNLLTDTANLHDVVARYQRILGQLPPEAMDRPAFDISKTMPAERHEAINRSLAGSPAIKAALANIESASRQIDVERSGMMPRVDAYLSQARDKNLDGIPGNTKETAFGFTVSWNLFEGGRTHSRARKAAENRHSATDLREKVCRDVRQNSAIAVNDFKRLVDQLPLLDQHQLSSDKAREAFRRQFDIGQRTLLDVLDTENEYDTARRNYLNGEMDWMLAQLRYLATSGELLASLKLDGLENAPPYGETEAAQGTLNGCPPEAAPPRKSQSYIALLNSPDGTTGKVIMEGSQGRQVVDQARMGVPLDGSAAPAPVSEEKLNKDFGDAMSARPRLPEQFTLYFELGNARLTRESTAQLARIYESIRGRAVPEVVIVGHADTTGNAQINERLSARRAQVVAEQIERQKLSLQSMVIEARGASEPALQTTKAELRNRRVVVSIR